MLPAAACETHPVVTYTAREGGSCRPVCVPVLILFAAAVQVKAFCGSVEKRKISLSSLASRSCNE